MVNIVLTQALFIVGRKHDNHGKAGLIVTYNTKSKELNKSEEENRIKALKQRTALKINFFLVPCDLCILGFHAFADILLGCISELDI